MKIEAVLTQQKVTKGTVVYGDNKSFSIYIPKDKLPTPFPDSYTMTLTPGNATKAA